VLHGFNPSILTHILLLTPLSLIAKYLQLYGAGDENSGGLPQDNLDAFIFKSIKVMPVSRTSFAALTSNCV
jgi:hypothetical protein